MANRDESISLNPFTEKKTKCFAHDTGPEIEAKLQTMKQGFDLWRSVSVDNRVRVIRKMADVMRRDHISMTNMIVNEMGKPVAQAAAEIEKCAGLCDWYAENGPAMLLDEPTSMTNGEAYVSYLPIGGIFAVMPWNFPFWQVMRGAVAILLGGNAYVLKHSSNVMGAAYMLEKAWLESGLPEGVFLALNVDHDTSGKIIADRRIAGATVTGSVRAGASVAATAGSVLKKSVLELGGADPFIVFNDADLDRAVASGVEARYQNTGQVCIAAKRFIIEESIVGQFTERFIEKVKSLRMGDPGSIETYIGPMARKDLRDQLHSQVQKSIKEGAHLACGGEFGQSDFGLGKGVGFFYQPTVLSAVKPGMTCFNEEMFGPVASIITARNPEHALELANDSEFGLSGAIWSENENTARSFARRMETGAVYINGMSATDARVPVGGVKKSGYGRELSHFGMREFLNAQTVWLNRK